ncbi:MAG: hypothetical protein U9N61_11085 [Euryarchaeota archaeon]|nr:hypothetical protein [Euryarchaeota archaeon]
MGRTFTDTQKAEIAKQAIEFWETSTNKMDDVFRAINDYERISRVLLPEDLQDKFDEHQDHSALVPPDIYNNLSALKAQVLNTVFARKPYAALSIDGKPNYRSDTIVKAEQVLQGMLDVSDFEKEAKKAIHQALYAGITAVYTSWKTKMAKIVQRDERQMPIRDENGNIVFKNEVVCEYAQTESIDFRRMRIDPSAEKTEDIRIVGHHTITHLSEMLLKKQQQNSPYDFDEKELERTSFDWDKYYEYVKGEVDTYPDKGQDVDNFVDKLVELWDVRGLFKIKNEDGSYSYEDLFVLIGNRTIPLLIMKNDLPLNSWDLYDFPVLEIVHGRMYTMGVVEPAMDLFIERFMKRNQSIDSVNRETYDRFIADESATQNLDDVIPYYPDQIIKVDLFASGARSIRDIFTPVPKGTDRGHDTFVQSEGLAQEIQQTMKENDYRQGSDPSRKETATAVDALVSGGKSLLGDLIDTLKASYFAPAFRKQLILYNFFKGHVQNTIFDSQGNSISISPGEINEIYRVDIDTSNTLDRPALIRRFVEMYPMLSQDPAYDSYEVRRSAVDLLQLPNPDKLLKPPEYLMVLVQREEIALMSGREIPVHPLDNDQFHIKSHMKAIEFVRKDQSGTMTTEVLMKHIEAHEEQMKEKQAQLGNTKEGGGLTGNMVQPQGARMKQAGKR